MMVKATTTGKYSNPAQVAVNADLTGTWFVMKPIQASTLSHAIIDTQLLTSP
jgi:hypothetical protein